MQPYEISTLPTGERVITEHVPSVRSVSFGFWIGTGSRDETDARAGVSHFIEHLLFKGTSRYSAQEIAEIFDGLGGELNAATSRETTLVYARVPDDRLEPGARRDGRDGVRPRLRRDRLRARGRARGDRDGRRQPAGSRPRRRRRGDLRRPPDRPAGDRPRRGDLDREQEGADRLPPGRLRGRQHRRRGGGERDARAGRRAARLPAARHRPERAARPQALRTRAAARLPLPAPGDRAVPRLPRRPRDLAPGRAPLRRVAARLDPRRLRFLAPLPGDPREARDGVFGLQLRLPVLRLGPDRALRRHARGEPRRVLRDRRARARGRRRRQRPAGRARARAGEPEGPDAALARVDLEPDEPARQVADHRRRAALAGRARRAGRRGDGGRRRRARSRAAAARPALGSWDRPVRGPLPGRDRARQPPALVERAAA